MLVAIPEAPETAAPPPPSSINPLGGTPAGNSIPGPTVFLASTVSSKGSPPHKMIPPAPVPMTIDASHRVVLSKLHSKFTGELIFFFKSEDTL